MICTINLHLVGIPKDIVRNKKIGSIDFNDDDDDDSSSKMTTTKKRELNRKVWNLGGSGEMVQTRIRFINMMEIYEVDERGGGGGDCCAQVTEEHLRCYECFESAMERAEVKSVQIVEHKDPKSDVNILIWRGKVPTRDPIDVERVDDIVYCLYGIRKKNRPDELNEACERAVARLEIPPLFPFKKKEKRTRIVRRLSLSIPFLNNNKKIIASPGIGLKATEKGTL